MYSKTFLNSTQAAENGQTDRLTKLTATQKMVTTKTVMKASMGKLTVTMTTVKRRRGKKMATTLTAVRLNRTAITKMASLAANLIILRRHLKGISDHQRYQKKLLLSEHLVQFKQIYLLKFYLYMCIVSYTYLCTLITIK